MVLLLALAMVVQAILPNLRVGGGSLLVYAIRPAIWLGIWYIASRLPKGRVRGGSRARGTVTLMAGLVAIAELSVAVLFGLFEGFAYSPYARGFKGMLFNGWVLGTEIAGLEYSRAWIVNRSARKNRTWPLYLVAIGFVLYKLPLRGMVTAATDRGSLLKYFGEVFLPVLAQSLLCTVSARIAGPMPGVIYSSLVSAFWWFCPTLPNLSWGAAVLAQSLVPALGMAAILAEEALHRRPRKRAGDPFQGLPGLVLSGIVLITMVWFAVGLFPIYPSVVVSGSMEPKIQYGDMVILAKRVDNLHVGDIIEFKGTSVSIIHRIVDIRADGGRARYVTKGDANDSPDKDLVESSMVTGRMLTVVPFVGRITIALRRLVGK